MFKSRKKDIERIENIEQWVSTLYDHLIKTRQEMLRLMDIANEQQKMINNLQKQQNEIVRLLGNSMEEEL